MDTQNRIPLSRLSPELRDLVGAGAPNYRKLHALALDGQLRTELINGRHYVQGPVSAVAAALGLVPAAPAKAPALEHAA